MTSPKATAQTKRSLYAQYLNAQLIDQPIIEQQNHKTSWVSRLLHKPVDQFVSSPQSLHYRARISLRPNPKGELGYFLPRSHQHVPISTCTLAHESINQVLRQLPPLPFAAQSAELRTNGTEVLIHLQSLPGKPISRKSCKQWSQAITAGIALDGKHISGISRTILHVGGIEHHLRPQTFYQINLQINQKIVEQVVTWTKSLSPLHVLDLYAGAGNLSLPLLKIGIPVTLIESSPTAIADAKDTLHRENLKATIHRQNAERFKAGQCFFDVALVDPPRKGAGKMLHELLLTSPKALLYLSCNPKSLATDKKIIAAAGYHLEKLILYDMFPQTSHVETLALFLRK